VATPWDSIPLPQLKPLPLPEFLPNNDNEGTESDSMGSHNLAFRTLASGSDQNMEADPSAESINDSVASEFVIQKQAESTVLNCREDVGGGTKLGFAAVIHCLKWWIQSHTTFTRTIQLVKKHRLAKLMIGATRTPKLTLLNSR
jgi:hypothetical protein